MAKPTTTATSGSQSVLELRDELVRSGMIGPPAVDDPTSTRQRMLEAAISLFADRGFDACTMRDLAGAVGVKAPAIYNHFDSKEQILAEASRDAMRRFYTVVIGPLAEDPEDERFEQVVKRWVLFQIEHREIARANDAMLDTGTLRRLLPAKDWKYLATSLQILLSIIRELVAADTDGDVEINLLVRTITAVCDRAGVMYRPGGALEPDEVADQTWLIVRRMTGVG